MHFVLAHIYHLLIRPFWHAPAAAFITAAIARLWWRRAAALAVLAGWLAAQYPALSVLPARPINRLAGLAILLLAYGWLAPRAGRRAGFLLLPGLALAASWWIAGAPLDGPGLAACAPVLLGVWAALALTRRLAASDRGWAGMGASLALAAALLLAGGAPHWGRAALVPAWAGLALVGVGEAVLPLAFATMLVGCLAVVASDRGRFVPVDLAVFAPLLVWFLAPRMLPRARRAGPVIAAGLATLVAAGVVLGAIRVLALR
jgi:hypothetical protein